MHRREHLRMLGTRMTKPRKVSEWDRHIRRFWALNRAAEGVMRQIVKVAWKEPETEAFLRGIHAQIEAKMQEENRNAPAVDA